MPTYLYLRTSMYTSCEKEHSDKSASSEEGISFLEDPFLTSLMEQPKKASKLEYYLVVDGRLYCTRKDSRS